MTSTSFLQCDPVCLLSPGLPSKFTHRYLVCHGEIALNLPAYEVEKLRVVKDMFQGNCLTENTRPIAGGGGPPLTLQSPFLFRGYVLELHYLDHPLQFDPNSHSTYDISAFDTFFIHNGHIHSASFITNTRGVGNTRGFGKASIRRSVVKLDIWGQVDVVV